MSGHHPQQPNQQPPLSPDSLLLLTAYVDGELAPASSEWQQAEALLKNSSQAQAEYLKLQQLRRTMTEHVVLPEPDSLWQAIQSEMVNRPDKPIKSMVFETPEAEYELIGAYYDNELGRDSLQFKQFESQLFENDHHNEVLGDIDTLSLSLKQWGYRLEEVCTIDVSRLVLAAYQAELLAQPDEATAERLSAYYDNDGISESEKLKTGQLLESQVSHQSFLQDLKAISLGLGHVALQLQATAPDVWPVIAAQVEADLLAQPQKSNVIPMAVKRWIPAASVAASVFLVFFALNQQPLSNPSEKSLGQTAQAPVTTALITESQSSSETSAQPPIAPASGNVAATKNRELIASASGYDHSPVVDNVQNNESTPSLPSGVSLRVYDTYMPTPEEDSFAAEAPARGQPASPSSQVSPVVRRFETAMAGINRTVSYRTGAGATAAAPAVQPVKPTLSIAAASAKLSGGTASRADIPSSEQYLIQALHEVDAPSSDTALLFDL